MQELKKRFEKDKSGIGHKVKSVIDKWREKVHKYKMEGK